MKRGKNISKRLLELRYLNQILNLTEEELNRSLSFYRNNLPEPPKSLFQRIIDYMEGFNNHFAASLNPDKPKHRPYKAGPY